MHGAPHVSHVGKRGGGARLRRYGTHGEPSHLGDPSASLPRRQVDGRHGGRQPLENGSTPSCTARATRSRRCASRRCGVKDGGACPLAAPREVGTCSAPWSRIWRGRGLRDQGSGGFGLDRGVEELGACPVCHSSSRTLITQGSANRLQVAPGAWNMFCCDACACRYLDPRPTRESNLLAYQG